MATGGRFLVRLLCRSGASSRQVQATTSPVTRSGTQSVRRSRLVAVSAAMSTVVGYVAYKTVSSSFPPSPNTVSAAKVRRLLAL